MLTVTFFPNVAELVTRRSLRFESQLKGDMKILGTKSTCAHFSHDYWSTMWGQYKMLSRFCLKRNAQSIFNCFLFFFSHFRTREVILLLRKTSFWRASPRSTLPEVFQNFKCSKMASICLETSFVWFLFSVGRFFSLIIRQLVIHLGDLFSIESALELCSSLERRPELFIDSFAMTEDRLAETEDRLACFLGPNIEN